MSSRVITPGPYRATKLWNEVTRLFRAGMPLRKHRQNFRHYASCFAASAAVEWLHQLLRSNSNFGPDVTRQQTVQLLKKFLKNHVIEDVKGRWGSEDLEDNNVLYRFPSTSPLKPIPCPSSGSIKKRPSFRDKDSFFRFKTLKKQHEEETLENVDPAPQEGGENHPIGEQQVPRRELTVEDEQEIWRDITVTHLQRILGVASLDEVLDHRRINPQNIIHNMTNVNKHGVVTLDDKTILLTEHIFSWTLRFSLPRVLLTFEPRSDPSDLSIIPLDDLPHWVLSAMKSLANWPKYDSAQPSYPGFERDVFKTVSDYFYSLPQPVLTYELYELFINVLVFCGYVAAPATHPRGKRKKAELPSAPPPAKTSFRSTECLLLSLLRQGTCDEAESPMGEVLGGKLQSRLAGLKGGDQLGGSSASLSAVGLTRPRAKSCSLETILDDSAPLTRQQLFLSNESLASCAYGNGSRSDGPAIATPRVSSVSKATASTWENGPAGTIRSRLPVGGASDRSRSSQPRSLGSCLDIVMETREEDAKEFKLPGRATSCLNVSSPVDQLPSAAWRAPSLSRHLPYFSSHHLFPSSSSSALDKAQGSHAAAGPSGPRAASSTCNLWTLPPATVGRRCLSSLDVSKPPRPVSLFKPPVCVPGSISLHPPPNPEHSLLQSHCERVAIEALQLCTLLLPPSSRRKLQLLMRMMSRISQNVDMPRLHPAIGTRTLMIHTFSGCVLGSAVECDLDELLATRLVSFLMDHQQSILSVPEYLLSAINDHIRYLRAVQVPIDGGDPVCAPMPMYAFCRQISGAEFEQQKLESSQKAMEELLEMLLTNQKIGEKDRRKKLKQFQKQYPDIYSRRFPSTDGEKMSDKPKIKPPLFNIRKTKAFSIRN